MKLKKLFLGLGLGILGACALASCGQESDQTISSTKIIPTTTSLSELFNDVVTIKYRKENYTFGTEKDNIKVSDLFSDTGFGTKTLTYKPSEIEIILTAKKDFIIGNVSYTVTYDIDNETCQEEMDYYSKKTKYYISGLGSVSGSFSNITNNISDMIALQIGNSCIGSSIGDDWNDNLEKNAYSDSCSHEDYIAINNNSDDFNYNASISFNKEIKAGEYLFIFVNWTPKDTINGDFTVTETTNTYSIDTEDLISINSIHYSNFKITEA